MNALHEARKRIKALVPDARNLVALDEALDGIGSIDKMTAEAANQKAVAEASRATAEQELSAVQARLVIANGELDEARNAAKEVAGDSAQAVEEAKAQAADLIKMAKGDAESILAAAKARVADLMTAAQAKADEISDAAHEAEETLIAVNKQVAEAQTRLDAVNAEIERVRARFVGA